MREVFEALGVEFEVRRKLPEDRPELFLELQHPGGEEIRQWFSISRKRRT
jgi:hypothetical protein